MGHPEKVKDEVITVYNRISNTIEIGGKTIPGESLFIIEAKKDDQIEIVFTSKHRCKLGPGNTKSSIRTKNNHIVIERVSDNVCEIHINLYHSKTGIINNSSKSIKIKDIDCSRGVLDPGHFDTYKDIYILTPELSVVSFIVDAKSKIVGRKNKRIVDDLCIKRV